SDTHLPPPRGGDDSDGVRWQGVAGAPDQRIGRRDRQQQQEHRQFGLIDEVGEGVQEMVSPSAEPPAERVGEAPGKSQRERNRDERQRNPAPRMQDKRERPNERRATARAAGG